LGRAVWDTDGMRDDLRDYVIDLTYAGTAGHALIDRELYLPRCWTADSQRCAAAGIPEGGRVRHQAGARQNDDWSRDGCRGAGTVGSRR
jgi:hypothetical protein